MSPDDVLSAKEHIYKLFEKALHKQEPCRPAQQILQTFFAEISRLINDKAYSLKPKIAFEVIVQRHALHGKVSYSSFKRLVRNNNIVIFANKATCPCPNNQPNSFDRPITLLTKPNKGEQPCL